jgi:hypothetical protein
MGKPEKEDDGKTDLERIVDKILGNEDPPEEPEPQPVYCFDWACPRRQRYPGEPKKVCRNRGCETFRRIAGLL